MSTHITDTNPSAVDAALMLIAVTFVSLLMVAIWLTAESRYAVDPALVTTPSTTPPVFYEEQP